MAGLIPATNPFDHRFTVSPLLRETSTFSPIKVRVMGQPDVIRSGVLQAQLRQLGHMLRPGITYSMVESPRAHAVIGETGKRVPDCVRLRDIEAWAFSYINK
jgi:hypothetical protein